MKIIPLHGRGAGVGCSQPEDPPRRLMPSAPPWRGFSGESSMPHGGTTKDENHSPPREGRRGGLSRTIGPTPKATPSAPPQRGFSGDSHMKEKIRSEVWRILLVFGLVVITEHCLTPLAHGQVTGCSDQALTLAEQQLTDTIAYLNTSQHARSTDPNNSNKWKWVGASDWTSGFFSGWQWYIYEKTLSNSWMTRAKAQTANLQSQATNASNHDIGFKILTSYGNGYRITRDPSYMSVIQTAAQTLSTLYRPAVGVIESWPSYDSKVTVIMDNMMNLELLFLAARNGGDPNWYNMAVSHALKT